MLINKMSHYCIINRSNMQNNHALNYIKMLKKTFFNLQMRSEVELTVNSFIRNN